MRNEHQCIVYQLAENVKKAGWPDELVDWESFIEMKKYCEEEVEPPIRVKDGSND